jgi:hypothetical protein
MGNPSVSVTGLRATGTYLAITVIVARISSDIIRQREDLPQIPWQVALAVALHQVNKFIAQNGTE